MDEYSERFPERKLGNRVKLSYKWTSEKVERLLDAGCSYGYGTKFLAEKANETWAIDINPEHIEIARSRYPRVNFAVANLERLPFEDEIFDATILNDVLEHTDDPIAALNEIYRVTKPNGFIIISVPHKGLFAFLDPYNYGYKLLKTFPSLYRRLFKLARLIKEGKAPEAPNPEHKKEHRHYSLKELERLLNASKFKDSYEIEKVFRSALLLEPLVLNLEAFGKILLKEELLNKLIKPFKYLEEIDYWIPCGPLSYNIAVKVRKKSP